MSRGTRGYGEGEGFPIADGATDPDSPGLPLDAGLSLGLPLPLGAGLALGTGNGVGSGNRTLGTFNAARTNMNAKPRITSATHARAMRSPRGGSAPRYPGARSEGRSALIGREA